ncbi:MAG: CusA/CzcA family heavy metal efflux RND transporter [Halieaceae bacterium]|nr:CusA/CzcA family heavy metal efflux RND transporter [Halieaceae bacterium]
MSTEGWLAALIRTSIRYRLLVLLGALALAVSGYRAASESRLDALPDISDIQVTLRASAPGMAPQLVEDLITYPLSRLMLSVPGASVVRGYSFFGDAYVYVLFEDGTDRYWARSRVQEYLDQAGDLLPAQTAISMGPDASGVGWIFSYALVDRSGTHSLADLRSLQDWFLRYELQGLAGVAEVASAGGMVREYQVVLDPERLAALRLGVSDLRAAIADANGEVGGGVIEAAGAELMVRSRGFLSSIEDIESIVVRADEDGTPLRLGDIARVRLGPQMRRVVTDLDGLGEVTGGIVVMRDGANALATIDRVRQRIDELRASLPPGVEIVETYNRSTLIRNSVDNLRGKLGLEMLAVAAVCLLFLLHLRSALVAVLTLPLGVLAALLLMDARGVSANIMSLGGIALSIGTMVDAAIVMIENAHKRLEAFSVEYGRDAAKNERWLLIADAAVEVGPALFLSLLLITVSFMPIFLLEAQEGRLFRPLALTKTYTMAAAAVLSVTLVPVLMGWLIRGRIRSERANPINRVLSRAYGPCLAFALRQPLLILALVTGLLVATLLPLSRLPGEFMPEFFEGDLMYMPTTLPGISIGEARALLQKSNAAIRRIPEVVQVYGKAGRADTATDPAPLTMIETVIRLKPREAWREGLDVAGLKAELDAAVQLPGLRNAWVMPIRTRIDMQSTGVKTALGVHLAGDDVGELQAAAEQIEAALLTVDGTASVIAERPGRGRYLDILPRREALGRFGLSMSDINEFVRYGIGGSEITRTVEGRERYPVALRFEQSSRDSAEALARLPIWSPQGAWATLGQIADIELVPGPAMLRSENGRPGLWLYVAVEDSDLAAYIERAEAVLADAVELSPGISRQWTGQFRSLERARERLRDILPITLILVVSLLYLALQRLSDVILVLLSLPFAVAGGVWLLDLLGHALSVASAVGFIALLGVAAEFGVVMLLYLERARRDAGAIRSRQALREAIMQGALQRLRPKVMTVAVVIAGLLPILLGTGAGSEVMQRIAAPMVGGMVSAPLISLFLIPVLYYLWHGRRLNATDSPDPPRRR